MPTAVDTFDENGLSIGTQTEREEALKAGLRSKVSPNLDLSADQPSGQFVSQATEGNQQVAELVQEVHTQFDPDQATGVSLAALASITGTLKRDATKGRVTLTLTLDASTTVPAGSIAAVTGEPTNQWILDTAVTSTIAGSYQGTATASEAGNVPAASGTITVIVTPVSGWTAVTNAADADAGSEIEKDPELRLRREVETELGGSASAGSVAADLSALEGMEEVRVLENRKWYASNGMPPHSIEPVIWDGSPSAVADATIAETIVASHAAGPESYGSTVYNYTDEQGNTHQIGFTRATQKVVQLEYTLTTDSSYPGDDAFKAYIASFDDANLGIGDDVLEARWKALAFDVAGVLDVPTFRLRFSGDAWGTIDLPVADREIATVDTSGITVI